MESNLIAGLVSGLFVTLFVLVFRKFWSSVVVPWFEERVYKDVRIEGKWYGLYPETTDYRQDVVVLKRHGHAISGKMICTNGGDEGVEYSIAGSFRNMILPLVYESTDKSAADRGSITLRCVNNGEVLSGKIALYRTNDDRVVSGAIIWFRKREYLESALSNIKKRKAEYQKIAEARRQLEQEEKEIEKQDLVMKNEQDVHESDG